jgi:uncharacterized RDD family membrane protein YckC
MAALFVDWMLSLVVAAFITAELHMGGQTKSLMTLAVFGAETWVLTGLMGTTIGKRVFGLHVARLDGRPVGLIWSFVRTALLLVVVPALLWDRDYRGLHDRAANTVVVRV